MLLSFEAKDILKTASQTSNVCAEETTYSSAQTPSSNSDPSWHIIRTMQLQMDGGSQVVFRVLSQGA